MAHQLVEQISAATTVLQGLSAVDPDSFAVVASAQRHRIEHAIGQLKNPTIQDMAGLTHAVSSSSFADADKRALMKAVASTRVMSPSAASESKFQDFESLADFLPTSLQAHLGKPEFSSAVLEFVLKLGLRKPSETTFRELALISLVGGEGMDRAMAMTPATRAGMLESTKMWFRRAVGRMPEANPYLHKLPASARDLQMLHPEFFQQVFGEDPVRPLERDAIKMELLRAATRCRREKSGCFSSSGHSSSSIGLFSSRSGSATRSSDLVSWGDLQQLLQQGLPAPTPSLPPALPNLRVLGHPKGAVLAGSPLQRSILGRSNLQEQPLALTWPDGVATGQPALQQRQQQPEQQPQQQQQQPQQQQLQQQLQQHPATPAPTELQREQWVRDQLAARRPTVQNAISRIEGAMAEKAEKQKARAAERRATMKRPAAAEGSHPEPKIMLSHEASRGQWLVRFQGLASKLFRYGKAGDAATAKEHALEYIRQQCEESELEVPAKFR